MTSHVLLADDDPMNRRIGQIVLEQMGCTVDLVEDGAQAAAAVIATHYDLVLMDCHMPEVDGYEATRIIRSAEGNEAHVIIVALTAAGAAEERKSCLDAGMDDFMEKPITVEGVRALLDTHATRAVPADPAQQTAGEEVDFQRLRDLRALGNGDEGVMFIRLLDAFEGGVARYLLAVDTALIRPDFDQLRKSAHGLKGSAASVGALAVRALAIELEDAAKAHDVHAAGVARDRVADTAARFQAAARSTI